MPGPLTVAGMDLSEPIVETGVPQLRRLPPGETTVSFDVSPSRPDFAHVSRWRFRGRG